MCGLSLGGGYPSWSIHRWGVPQLVHGGVSQLVQPKGGPLLCSLLGGPLLWSLSGGVPCDLSHNALRYCYRMPQCIMGKIHMGLPRPLQGSTSMTTLGGVPCDLFHNALDVISLLSDTNWWVWLDAAAYILLPQCIMGLGHMGPPELNRLTDRQTRLKTLPSRTTLRAVINNAFHSETVNIILDSEQTPIDSLVSDLLIYTRITFQL